MDNCDSPIELDEDFLFNESEWIGQSKKYPDFVQWKWQFNFSNTCGMLDSNLARYQLPPQSFKLTSFSCFLQSTGLDYKGVSSCDFRPDPADPDIFWAKIKPVMEVWTNRQGLCRFPGSCRQMIGGGPGRYTIIVPKNQKCAAGWGENKK